jgi:anti-sigma regulatory factor (Ser/Thr protein kinase)
MGDFQRMPEHVEYVHHSWPAELPQLPSIRQAVQSWLRPLALNDSEAADVVQAVNEAATNVIQHAYQPDKPGTVELTLWPEPGALYIEIIDHGSWQPPQEASPPGRGFLLMQGMVESVLIHFDARGSRVMLRHPMPSHALAADDAS